VLQSSGVFTTDMNYLLVGINGGILCEDGGGEATKRFTMDACNALLNVTTSLSPSLSSVSLVVVVVVVTASFPSVTVGRCCSSAFVFAVVAVGEEVSKFVSPLPCRSSAQQKGVCSRNSTSSWCGGR
jgi:hypothetical protein